MNSKSIVAVVLMLLLLMFVVHATYVTSNAYSHPSVVLQSSTSNGLVSLIFRVIEWADGKNYLGGNFLCYVFSDRVIMDDFREAYHWLRENTRDDARIMSWWDYGYQIAGMANRTTLVDNNTWNNSHIALVSSAFELFVSQNY